jgi:hypothetical protein
MLTKRELEIGVSCQPSYAISPYLRKADRVNIAIINAKINDVVGDLPAAFAN